MSENEKLIAVISLALAGTPPVSDDEGQAITASYVLALSDIPLEFVTAGLANLLGGAVDSYSGDWAPRPAQIAKEARRLWYDKSRRDKRDEALQRQLTASEQPKRELSESEMQERAKKVDTLIGGINFGADMAGRPIVPRHIDKQIEMDNAGKWLEAKKHNPGKIEHVSDELAGKFEPE